MQRDLLRKTRKKDRDTDIIFIGGSRCTYIEWLNHGLYLPQARYPQAVA